MSIFDRLHGMRKKVAAGAIAAATLVAGIGFAAPAYADDFRLVGPDTVPTSDKFQITALGLPADVATDEITWKTSNWRNAMQSIWPQDQGNTSTWDADISIDGDGTVTISATYQGQTAEKTVQLEKKSYVYLAGFDLSANGLEGSGDEYTLHVPSGGTVDTSATFTPADATYQHLIWQSMDPSIVRAGADGVIRAVSNGSADLVVYSYGRVHKKTIHVTVGGGPVVVPVDSVTLDSTAVSLKVGATQKLNATVAPSNATNKKVTWSSSNAGVASVDVNGTITAVAAGTATITATADGKTVSATVTVTNGDVPTPSVTGVSINGGNVEMAVNAIKKLTFVVTPEGAASKSVEWLSGNESVAAVDANGVVTAKAVGTATIFVLVDGYMDQIEVTVKNSGPIPVELQSVAIAGSGVAGGEMAMKVGEGRQLSVVPTP
ncbi:Ig-like domain-containing protein, partial [Bifidobacterium sp. AGR2158]|uniref:Ig-like domain-containing protein n=1 Tax=Bifidobacterium sp. AGR2158 TaxID=1280675 RepID=UPI0018C933EE